VTERPGGVPAGTDDAAARRDGPEGMSFDPGLVPDPPMFVGRDLYRRRRVMDTAKLLPAFGTVLVMMPILWASDRGTASGLVYMFVVWAVLVLMAALISRRLSEPLQDPMGQEDAAERLDGGGGG
jgi:hypothetical protein